MGKSLIITEKPSVAREYAQVLKVSGNRKGYIENERYVITWCVGHLVEMVYPEQYDEKYKKWRLEDLPFLPQTYKYDVIANVAEQYEIVHGMLHREDIDVVYWAGDSGKEGQTIEENIRNFGGVREGMKELRVWIDSQTEEEILRGLKEAKPMEAYANLGKSGIMRSVEDYAMGINFSRALSVRYGHLLNQAAGTKSYTAIAIGRVMTCVLGMVVIREREIRDFVETPFYRVVGSFTEAEISGEWKAVDGSKYFASPLLYKENGFLKEADAKGLIAECEGKPAVIETLEKGSSKKRAPLLFNLAELQAECAKRFKISPDRTLQIAQELYERKLTTYPRTDARVLSSAVAKEITNNIAPLRDYTPVSAFVSRIMNEGRYRGIGKSAYTDDAKVTDHYAIIPTGHVRELQGLSALHKRVYDLIVRRFLAIFYPQAQYETVKLVAAVGQEKFFANAKVLKEPGFLEVTGRTRDDDAKRYKAPQGESGEQMQGSEWADAQDGSNEKLLAIAASLKKGDTVSVNGYEVREGKTSPPKRYTSGSMVLAMENAGQLIEDEELREQIKGSGIGTSATRAEIIKKLVRNGYLKLNAKTQVLTPERLGEMIFEVVSLTVPQLLNPKMTASWEKGLDGITRGNVDLQEYREKLESFIREETVKMIQRDLTQEIAGRISQFAGKDGRGIGARRKIEAACPACGGQMETTPFGYGCSNYKKDGSGCRFAIGKIAGRDLTEDEVRTLLTDGKTGVLEGFASKKRKKFRASLVVLKDEEGRPNIGFDFSANEPVILENVKCPACGAPMVETGFGYACSRRRREDADGCYFAIGKIAEKSVTKEQVRALLQGKRTGTIRGFKGKSGKRFDACLALSKDEQTGRFEVRFDFEHVEPKKLKDVRCPLCGGDIVVTPFGYGCSGYRQNEEESCRFAIGKMSGKALTEAQVRKLLSEGKTDVIQGFVAKTGMMFEASLKLSDDHRVVFDFPQKPEPEETTLACPRCGKMLLKTQWRFECECGFTVSHTVAKVELSEDTMRELFLTGHTKKKITGFTSKAGNLFNAYLKLTDNGKIVFDFDEAVNPVSGALPTAEKLVARQPEFTGFMEEQDKILT